MSFWKKKRVLFVSYTFFFVILFWMCFSFLYSERRTFLFGGDAWTQTYQALIYYRRYLLNVFSLFLQGDFVLPQWDYAIGEGGDILQTLHYYVLGDPFNLGVVFVSEGNVYLYYMAVTVLRLYLSGISLIFYLWNRNQSKSLGILIAALMYCFSGWGIFNVVRYPYFINCLIFFPLILTGVEHILSEKKGSLLTFGVFLSGISSFYFFYMIVWGTVVYVLVRMVGIIVEQRRQVFVEASVFQIDYKKIGRIILTITLRSLWGVMFAAPILIPMIYAALGSTRVGIEHISHLLFSGEYYQNLAWYIVNGTETKFTLIGIGAPIFTGLGVFVLQKGHRQEKILLGLAFLTLLIPSLGKLLNGNSYISNRFCWMLIWIVCVCISIGISELSEGRFVGKKRQLVLFLVWVLLVVGIALFAGEHKALLLLMLGLEAVVLVSVFLISGSSVHGGIEGSEQNAAEPGDGNSRKQSKGIPILSIAAFLMILGVCIMGLWLRFQWMFQKEDTKTVDWYLSKDYMSSVKDSEGIRLAEGLKKLEVETANVKTSDVETLEVETANVKTLDVETANVETLKTETQFHRYASNLPYKNSGMLAGLSSPCFYWSVYPSVIDDTIKGFGLCQAQMSSRLNYGESTILSLLSGIDYYVDREWDVLLQEKVKTKEEERTTVIPYGYEYSNRLSELTGMSVYQSELALPLGFTYETVISEADWRSLSIIQRQEVLLYCGVVEDFAAKPDSTTMLISKEKEVLLGMGEAADESEIVKLAALEIVDGSVNVKPTTLEIVDEDAIVKPVTLELAGERGARWNQEEVDIISSENQITFLVEGVPNTETYLVIQGLCWEPEEAYRLGYDDVNSTSSVITVFSNRGESRTLEYISPEADHYGGRHDFAINLGFGEEAIREITLSFSQNGRYSFSNMECACLSLEGLEERLDDLRADTLEHCVLGKNRLTGTIALMEPKLLCIQIPFAKGWKAYVDGEPCELVKTNIQYMGLWLTEGEHEIELVYHTPGLRVGLILFFFGIVCLPIGSLVRHLKMRQTVFDL